MHDTAELLIGFNISFNFFDNNSISICCNAKDIWKISSAARRIGGFGFKCDVIEINADDSITAQVIGGFFEFFQSLTAHLLERNH